MIAFAIPFMVLSNRGWASIGVLFTAIACAALGFADDYRKIVKRRSLGLRARTKLVVTIAISLGLWWVGDAEGAARIECRSVGRACRREPRTAVSDLHLPGGGWDDERAST